MDGVSLERLPRTKKGGRPWSVAYALIRVAGIDDDDSVQMYEWLVVLEPHCSNA